MLLGQGGDYGVAGSGGGGAFVYDTPANQPVAIRQMHSGGGGGLGGNARVGRHMSGGSMGGSMGSGMGGGGLLAAQLGIGGGGMGGRQSMQNDKRQSMGLPGSAGFQCARERGQVEGRQRVHMCGVYLLYSSLYAWHARRAWSPIGANLRLPLPTALQPEPACEDRHPHGGRWVRLQQPVGNKS